ncbi:MAG: DUF1499 domain-containing protein [Gemmatimonadetes bacterium]|nr:DUF1499 domain-containing protein [Gemmatimonadota bacterium]
MTLWSALTKGAVTTAPSSDDPDLCGRTYTIPFGDVWDAVVRLTAGGLRGWKMIRWDDDTGLVEAEVHGRMLNLTSDISVSVTLDVNAQTRVDLAARKRGRWGDLGANRRRVRRFVRELDRQLNASEDQILRTGRMGSAA